MTPEVMNYGGIIILEPLTSLTDVITGLTGIFLAYLLWKDQLTTKSETYFFRYLLFLGIGTLCGGMLGHALLHYLAFEAKLFGWSFSTIGMFFLELGSIYYLKDRLSDRVFKVLRILFIAQLVLFVILQANPATRNFKVVQLNATFVYVVISMPLYLTAIFSWKKKWVWPIVASILFAGAIAGVYNLQVTYNDWFNHHVITHFMMTLFVIFMFLSLRHLNRKKRSLLVEN